MEKNHNYFENSIGPYMNVRELNFLEGRADILQALMKSKEEGTAIAIRATVLGMEPIVTAVEDVSFDDGLTIIVLKHYDATGYILPSKRLNLLEIQSVCPFTTPFSNPYLQNLNKDKSWFF